MIFDWCWGQHACMLLPNGNISCLTNGFNRQFINGVPSYSRGVEYRINEENMTVQEIWQHGKERAGMLGAHHQRCGRADNTNRLITSGIVFGAEPYAKIMEVSYPDRTVVYEITLHFKNLLAAGGLCMGWAGSELQGRAYPYLSTIKRRPEPPFQVSSAISELQFRISSNGLIPLKLTRNSHGSCVMP